MNQFNFHFGNYSFFAELDHQQMMNYSLNQLDWQSAFPALNVSLHENRAANQYAGRGRSIFVLRSFFLNINPRGRQPGGFLLKPQKSMRKTRQCYMIPPRSLSCWTPARCERSTRQHLFSELLRSPRCPPCG